MTDSPITGMRHSDHCRACKERLRELLAALYGECRVNPSFPWPARPDDYAGTPAGIVLSTIRNSVAGVRGHGDFIKSPVMPPCDYYLPAQRLIVEFDETQHFTRPRLAALSLYPGDRRYGFSVARWRELCRRIDARDDTPFDRDERRAWYDTLRDLLPPLHGFAPTIRLYAGEHAWCALDPKDFRDVEAARGWLEGLANRAP